MIQLAAFLLAPAFAFSQEFDARINEVHGIITESQVKTLQAQAERRASSDQAIIDSTLTGMADANPAGESVVEFIRENGIPVHFSGMLGLTAVGAIELDQSLPRYPRVLAPAIARKAMELKLAKMPECAEREYMIRSVAARSWIELGGEPKGLPVIEPLIGYKDVELAAYIEPWVRNPAEMALYKIGQATGKPELAAIKGHDRPEDLEADKKWDKAFTDFLIQENEWRRMFAGR
ncbi:MAG: hypothetical protein NTX64_07020 [Elusimicrobia bacterium]|nr:hypothetical protein [Elusimicrobiota bacterium]